MIEQILKNGRGQFINIKILPGVDMGRYRNGSLISNDYEHYSITERSSSLDISKGPSADRKKQFLWIPWIPGSISEVAGDVGLDIITGPMSGCWIVNYMKESEFRQYTGHIGTYNTTDSPESVAAKAKWRELITKGVKPIVGFCPSSVAFDTKEGQQLNAADPIIYALVTDTKMLYTIIIWRVPGIDAHGHAATKFKLGTVYHVKSATKDVLIDPFTKK